MKRTVDKERKGENETQFRVFIWPVDFYFTY